MIFRTNYFKSLRSLFFTINPKAYHSYYRSHAKYTTGDRFNTSANKHSENLQSFTPLQPETFLKLTEDPETISDISEKIQLFRRDLTNLPFSKRDEYFKNNPRALEYFDLLARDLQSETSTLYKSPFDLMNILNDLYKINASLIRPELISQIIKNQILKVDHMSPDLLAIICTFFAKFQKESALWNFVKEQIYQIEIQNFGVSALTHISWALFKMGELNEELSNEFHEHILKFSDTLTFLDITIMMNIYKETNDIQKLRQIASIFIQNEKNYRFKRILVRDLTEFLLILSSLKNFVSKETWGAIIREYLVPRTKYFIKSTDIAYLMLVSNKINQIIEELPDQIKYSYQVTINTAIETFLNNHISSFGKPTKINEQDLCNILYSALNLEFIEGKLLQNLIDLFLNNFINVKPAGIGICLHGICDKKRYFFYGNAGRILEKISHNFRKITDENVGYIFSILKELSEPIANHLMEKIITLIQDIPLENSRSIFSIDQFFLSFASLEIGEKLNQNPRLLEKMLDIFIFLNKTKELEDISLLPLSVFLQSLMNHYEYSLTNKDAELIQTLTRAIHSSLQKSLKSGEGLKGAGSLVYNYFNAGLRNENLEKLIIETCKDITFEEMDASEGAQFLVGIKFFLGSKSSEFQSLKTKFFKEKIEKFNLSEFRKFIRDGNQGNLGNEIINTFRDDFIELIKIRKANAGPQDSQFLMEIILQISSNNRTKSTN